MATVQLKYGERVLKLRPQSMSIANLAMIFKLDANEGVYLTSEEGEIILPGENSSFSIDNFDVCYTVNGEQVAKGGRKLQQPVIYLIILSVYCFHINLRLRPHGRH